MAGVKSCCGWTVVAWVTAVGATLVACGDARRGTETPCTPITCAAEGKDCGRLPDGCGGVVECGTCGGGTNCGGGGPNVCGTGTCTPTTCAARGKDCGIISDECTDTLDCGSCDSGETCGAGGVPNVCGSGRDGGSNDSATPQDGAGPDGSVPDAGGEPIACGEVTCAVGEYCLSTALFGGAFVCIPRPSGCSGAPACGCFDADPCTAAEGSCSACQTVSNGTIQCMLTCVCLAGDTRIATPDGERRVSELQAGDLVYSLRAGREVIVPIKATRKQPVFKHSVVRLSLENGTMVEVSATHPMADGRPVANLEPGESSIVALETVPYTATHTYDILPDSDSGAYRVGGLWFGSTLRPSRSSFVQPQAPAIAEGMCVTGDLAIAPACQ